MLLYRFNGHSDIIEGGDGPDLKLTNDDVIFITGATQLFHMVGQ